MIIERDVIVYKGYSYVRYPSAKQRSHRVYYKRSGYHQGEKYLHRTIWMDSFGEIPKGHEVHHKDENPLNNDIDNLECLTKKGHREKHELTIEQIEKSKIHLDKIRHLATDWHKTEEGKESTRRAAKISWDKREPIDVTCIQCSLVFKSRMLTNKDKYCSRNCSAKYRRANKLDHSIFKCSICDSEFSSNKTNPSKTCSMKCRGIQISRTRKGISV